VHVCRVSASVWRGPQMHAEQRISQGVQSLAKANESYLHAAGLATAKLPARLRRSAKLTYGVAKVSHWHECDRLVADPIRSCRGTTRTSRSIRQTMNDHNEQQHRDSQSLCELRGSLYSCKAPNTYTDSRRLVPKLRPTESARNQRVQSGGIVDW